MFGWMGLGSAGDRRKPPAPPKAPKTPDDGRKPASPAPKPNWDDELYSAGDICAPEPDRDDEQRDL